MSECKHDKRFGLFGLPKEAHGCLACAYEQAVPDAERWRWWRKRFAALTTMQCAQAAGLDLTTTYVDSPEKLDAVTDAARGDHSAPARGEGGSR